MRALRSVVIAGIGILWAGFPRLDPAVALGLALLVAWRSWIISQAAAPREISLELPRPSCYSRAVRGLVNPPAFRLLGRGVF